MRMDGDGERENGFDADLHGADAVDAHAFDAALSRMMHRSETFAPYEPRHRERLWTGIERHDRMRRAQAAGGAVVALAAVLAGVLVVPTVLGGDSDGPGTISPASSVGGDPGPGLTSGLMPGPSPGMPQPSSVESSSLGSPSPGSSTGASDPETPSPTTPPTGPQTTEPGQTDGYHRPPGTTPDGSPASSTPP